MSKKPNMNIGFLFLYEWASTCELLNNAEFRELFRAILAYQKNGTPLPAFKTKKTELVAGSILPTLDRRLKGMAAYEKQSVPIENPIAPPGGTDTDAPSVSPSPPVGASQAKQSQAKISQDKPSQAQPSEAKKSTALPSTEEAPPEIPQGDLGGTQEENEERALCGARAYRENPENRETQESNEEKLARLEENRRSILGRLSDHSESEQGLQAQTPPENRFERFWEAYPKKVGRVEAELVFRALKADDALVDRMLEAISEQQKNKQWQEDDGRYIPNPVSWLRYRRWEDKPPEPSPARTCAHSSEQSHKAHGSFDTDEFFNAALRRGEEWIRSMSQMQRQESGKDAAVPSG